MVRYRASCIGETDFLPASKGKRRGGAVTPPGHSSLIRTELDNDRSRAASTSDLIKRRAVLAAAKTAPPTAVAFGQS
jgi:hypothetical protein